MRSRSTRCYGSFKVVPGTRVGAYEVLEPVGSGGMGEVYRARDTKLHRDVALKFLPVRLATDPERVARFRREAQILAALNHPHIAQIYGLEESNGSCCIAMELVDGETLVERVRRGPIPVEEALHVTRDIAEALEAAHEKGIVHRDLKPANVKVTPDGQVKVLDFGLAKLQASTTSPTNLSNAPTVSIEATSTGVVLGTAPYMSPEQARGATTDHRSDVFSFGCVLHEMLTGRATFQGETVSDVIASVLARDPDLGSLPTDLNPKTRDLIRRCLEKDVRRRWQAIGDVRVEIEAILEDPRGLKVRDTETQKSRGRRHFIASVVLAPVASFATGAVVWKVRQPPPEAITRLGFALPEDMRFTRPGRHVIAVSPDGSSIALVANDQIHLRNMDDMEIHALSGTDSNVSEPFFSPDGRWLAYTSLSDRKLKKIAVTGGPAVTGGAPVEICDSQNPFGSSWTSDGQILIGQGAGGIASVAAGGGGTPKTIVTVDSGEVAYGPQMLPDGENILFTLGKLSAPPVDWDQAQIVLQSLKSGKRNPLISGGSDARYAATGHIVYARGSTLLAAPFDVKSFRVGGSAPVVEDVLKGPVGAAQFGFSRNGTMVYVPGVSLSDADRSLALFDLRGTITRLDVPPGPYFNPHFSWDGKQIALHRNDGEIWIVDVRGISPMRKLPQKGSQNPVWTRDERIVFTSQVENERGLSWQRADGSALAEQLVKPGTFRNPIPMSVSPDGTLFFKGLSRDDRMVEIYTLSLNGDRTPKMLFSVPGRNVVGVSLSPVGGWLAYEWNQGPHDDNIHIEPFPRRPGVRHQITYDGGWQPMWSRDGKRLFYVHPPVGSKGPSLWSVDIRTEPSVQLLGKPAPLFPIEDRVASGAKPVDFSPVSNQFAALLLTASIDASRQVNVVLNWFKDLERRVPVQ